MDDLKDVCPQYPYIPILNYNIAPGIQGKLRYWGWQFTGKDGRNRISYLYIEVFIEGNNFDIGVGKDVRIGAFLTLFPI
jgi:hypothetical protein